MHVHTAGYDCAAGTYGAVPGLSTASCSGLCPAGFACPVNTIVPVPCSSSSSSSGDSSTGVTVKQQYSLGGAAECTDCPGTAADRVRAKVARRKHHFRVAMYEDPLFKLAIALYCT
eukprot:14874-Heterococcus_DN1.PRE.5